MIFKPRSNSTMELQIKSVLASDDIDLPRFEAEKHDMCLLFMGKEVRDDGIEKRHCHDDSGKQCEVWKVYFSFLMAIKTE